jgi:hypothetical protein
MTFVIFETFVIFVLVGGSPSTRLNHQEGYG